MSTDCQRKGFDKIESGAPLGYRHLFRVGAQLDCFLWIAILKRRSKRVYSMGLTWPIMIMFNFNCKQWNQLNNGITITLTSTTTVQWRYTLLMKIKRLPGIMEIKESWTLNEHILYVTYVTNSKLLAYKTIWHVLLAGTRELLRRWIVFFEQLYWVSIQLPDMDAFLTCIKGSV